MINLWKRISYLGVTLSMDFRLARRIVLSNRFGLLIAMVAFFFLITFFLQHNVGMLPMIGMILIAAGIWFFNGLDLTRLSRLIACLVPAIGVFILNISQKFGQPETINILQYATPRMIIVGSAILPFVMFVASERRYVWSAASFILLLAFLSDEIHKFFGVDYQSVGLENSLYGIIQEDMIVLSIIVVAASAFMLSINDQYDIKTQTLLQDTLLYTESLKKNEENLRKTLSELEESHKKDDARGWVARGIAELNIKLQAADDTTNVYEVWLSSLIKYLNVNQGGLFIAEESDAGNIVLKQAATYAYERKKHLQKTIVPGEGILGQVFMEGRRMYLKRLPHDYIHITSGLGNAPPKVLVVMPIKANQSTEAVLELASFHELEEHHFELLNALGESLATFIASNKTNLRTRNLLHQAQTMSEELHANEEEMRQNLEELTATQEALTRKERDYQERIVELEAALSSVKREGKMVEHS